MIAKAPPPTSQSVLPDHAFAVLHELAVASAGVLDPAGIAAATGHAAKLLLRVDSAALFWYEPSRCELRALSLDGPQFSPRAYKLSDPGVTTEAFRTHRPVIVDDYGPWRSPAPQAVAQGVESALSVPLIVGDRAVGALTVCTLTRRGWIDQDIQLLGLLAAQVAPSLEAARLHHESEQRRIEAEALAELVRVGATEREPDRVVAFICEQAARLIGADYDGLVLVGQDGSRTWSGMWGQRTDLWRGQTRGRGTGSVARVVNERRTVVIENIGSNPDSSPYVHLQEGGKTVLSTPLIIRENLLGALTFGWRTPTTPSPDQIRMAETVARYAATVLDNARAYADEQSARAHAEQVAETLSQRERILQSLRDIAMAAGGMLDPQALAQLVVDSACAMLGLDSAGVYWWQASEQVLTRLAEHGMGRGTGERNVRPGSGVSGQAFEQGRTVIVEDYPDWPDHLAWAVARGIQSIAGVPLRMKEHTLGTLVVRSHTRRHFEAEEIHVLELLAAQVAPALEAARLHAESERRRSEAVALAELARQGATAHEVAPAADLICRRARQLVGADFAAVLAQSSFEGLTWLGVAGNQSDIWTGVHRTGGRGPAGRAIAEGRTMIFRKDGARGAQPLVQLRVLGAEDTQTALAVPLLRQGGPFGSIVMGWRSDQDVSPEQQRLAEALGGYAAAVLDNALSHAESERRRVEAEAMAELARLGAVEHDTGRLMIVICEQVKRLTGADYTGLRLVNEDGTLGWHGMAGNRTHSWQTTHSMTGRGGAKRAFDSHETVITYTEVLQAEGNFSPNSVRAKEGGIVEMATPLVYHGEARGALVLGWRTDVDPSAEQRRVAEALASYAAVVLENARAHVALAQQALYDELTELPNRRLFQDRLEQAMLVAQRTGHPIALLLMDLDRFKEVNDTLGHQAGDVLLRDISQRLRRSLRSSDTVARLGGDEFAVVLTSMHEPAGAAVAANKLLAAIGEPAVIKGQPIHASASIGIAFYPEHGQDPETLLRHADVAMYVAKRTGGGSATYMPHMDRDHADRLSLVQDLRRALDESELTLEYQPRVTLGTGKTRGVEALVRWQHPEHGLVKPAHFIPLAEQTGLIRRISRWVLETVFQQRREWANQGLELEIAVNLSMRDLHDPQMPNIISQLAQAYREQPDWLIIEITEGAVMSEPALAQRALAKLHTLGIRVAIDDFGTGYSSLSYLNQLMVDEIKVDRSFVDRMAWNQKNYAIVRATIEMGHALGAAVIAEGVEEQADLDLLNQLSCDGVQGFLLSTPLAPRELVEWLEARA